VGALRGVGPRVAEQLAKVSVTSAQDLLFHLPLRYQDRTRVVPIADLKPGAEVLVEGEIGGTWASVTVAAVPSRSGLQTYRGRPGFCCVSFTSPAGKPLP